MSIPERTGECGDYRLDDGCSRQFGGGTPRDIVAEALARRSGWAEIRPTHWASAPHVVKALKDAGWLRTPRERKDAA